MSKLSKENKLQIINEYQNNLVPMEQLALHFSVSRQAIYKILKKNKIDTTKHKLPVPCTCCGKETFKHKCQLRTRKNHFCSIECYYAWVESLSEGPYIKNRHSQRLARVLISKLFNLQPSHVVHHKDRNNLNNQPNNLLVFANQGDHIRHHRGLNVTPLWP